MRAIALTLALIAALIAGCGGGSGASSAVATSKPESSTEGGAGASATAAAPTATSTQPARAEHAVAGAQPRFGSASQVPRVKGGDNSIQDFGQEAGESDRQAVAHVLTAYLGALYGRDAAAACALLSSTMKANFERLTAQSGPSAPKGCTAFLKTIAARIAASPGSPDVSHPRVLSVRIDGDRGFVIFDSGEKPVYNMPLAREASGWRVAAVGPIPLQV